MSKNSAVDATAKIVEVLTPLSTEERMRAMRAAVILLGEKPVNAGIVPHEVGSEASSGEPTQLPPRAHAWMKQNGVTSDQLEQVFHIAAGTVEIVAPHVPGRNRKEQTYNAYILSGAAQLLATGTPSFHDKAARALCESSGCYDSANHSAYLKDRGNEFTGSKEKGWTLTAPGLKRAAELIKESSRQKG